jgi:hypothetical protein
MELFLVAGWCGPENMKYIIGNELQATTNVLMLYPSEQKNAVWHIQYLLLHHIPLTIFVQ